MIWFLDYGNKMTCTQYPRAQRQFFFGQYIIIPKKKIGHKQKGTTLEPLGSLSYHNPETISFTVYLYSGSLN